MNIYIYISLTICGPYFFVALSAAGPGAAVFHLQADGGAPASKHRLERSPQPGAQERRNTKPVPVGLLWGAAAAVSFLFVNVEVFICFCFLYKCIYVYVYICIYLTLGLNIYIYIKLLCHEFRNTDAMALNVSLWMIPVTHQQLHRAIFVSPNGAT